MKSSKSKSIHCPEKLAKKRKKLQHKLDRVNKKLGKAASERSPSAHLVSAVERSYSEFVKVREKSFLTLTEAIVSNLRQNSSPDLYDIEKISLKMEQEAILACMQPAIYKEVVDDIIKHVNDYTSEKKMIPVSEFKLPYLPEPSPRMEEAQPIPTVPMEMSWLRESREHFPSPTPPIAKISPTVKVPQVTEETPPDKIALCEAMNLPETGVEAGLEDFLCHYNDSPIPESPVDEEPQETANDSNAEDDMELEHLMNILQGNLTEGKQNLLSLDKRLNKMKDLFGDENECPESSNLVKENVQEDENHSQLQRDRQRRHIRLWRNERFIFLHKVLSAFKRMPADRFFMTRRKFSLYFGEDSDYEHEFEFDNREKYLACCSRRIFSAVAQFVMPYLKQGRICNGSYIFKNLVRRIADSLIEINDYPSSYEVRCFVDRFFPPGKKYTNVTDVWTFLLDQ